MIHARYIYIYIYMPTNGYCCYKKIHPIQRTRAHASCRVRICLNTPFERMHTWWHSRKHMPYPLTNIHTHNTTHTVDTALVHIHTQKNKHTHTPTTHEEAACSHTFIHSYKQPHPQKHYVSTQAHTLKYAHAQAASILSWLRLAQPKHSSRSRRAAPRNGRRLPRRRRRQRSATGANAQQRGSQYDFGRGGSEWRAWFVCKGMLGSS